MQDRQFIVVDRDFSCRNQLAHNLSRKGYVITLDRMEELGTQRPKDAWVFVGDDGDQVELTNGPCVGYVQWPTDGIEFWRSFEALEKRIPLRSEAAQVAARARRMLAVLTDREREIAEGISQGLSTKEMAEPLGISPRTIEVHRGNILAKLDARNMAGLVRLVVESELSAPS